ncbi:MAG TPA: SUMF1/EgtB/PvdO family nonheme iron enzyme [Solirubrobacteraceae bacterium]|nr:SUMF1/EgtB/PvdO family nonheme iron enzyme [Solirubrobacteraceae bacterium]
MSATSLSPDTEQVLIALEGAREQTLALVAGVSAEDLERVHSPIMSPLVWDIGHIAAYEDLWIAHRLGGLELLREDLASVYDAFETPRAVRGEAEALRPRAAFDYLQNVRARTSAVLTGQGSGDGTIAEMVLRHEMQHCETMRQTLAIAGLLPAGEPALAPLTGPEGWIEIPAGSFEMGAPEEGFAYDNERPRHERASAAFQIARRPVSNASWMHFSEGGGYERREWWSREGWAWKQEYDITDHAGIAAGHPEAPVCHVSWFEADAFARAHTARLPTEAGWERAATWSQERPEGIGSVWEWTATEFDGYPGFRPYPYREYSEVFFKQGYRVLRGGSWATSPRVRTTTFRNWDLPQRRQIFAGLRLAREA